MKYGAPGIFGGIALAVLLAVPTPTYAMKATFFGPIVPAECHCDNQTIQGQGAVGTVNTAPDFGCVLQTIENGINFAVTLSTILFTIYLVITGFAFIISGGSSEARSKAKTRFMNVFIGLAVLLCAWLIVDYIMKTIYNEGRFGPWNALLEGSPTGHDRCIVPRMPTAVSVGQVAFSVPAGTGPAGGTPAGAGPSAGGTGHSGMNIQTAVQYANQHAASSSTGYCARYVHAALVAGGLHISSANAYQFGPILSQAGFSSVYTGTYNGTAFSAQAGDVVVFQRATNQSTTQYGHIAIFDGSQWISDYRQGSTMGPSKYNGISYTIYRP